MFQLLKHYILSIAAIILGTAESAIVTKPENADFVQIAEFYIADAVVYNYKLERADGFMDMSNFRTTLTSNANGNTVFTVLFGNGDFEMKDSYYMFVT